MIKDGLLISRIFLNYYFKWFYDNGKIIICIQCSMK